MNSSTGECTLPERTFKVDGKTLYSVSVIAAVKKSITTCSTMWNSQRNRIAQLETTISRYEQDINALKEQISNLSKDHLPINSHAVEHLKEANQALVDIYKNRWSFFGVIFPIVTILLTATFAYNIWKADQLNKIEKDGLRTVAEVESVRNLLVRQADVAGHFAEAMSMLNMGYREASRERYSFSAKQGTRAADQLYAAKALIEASLSKDLDIQSQKITDSLKGTAQELLLAACELKARSYMEIYLASRIGGAGDRTKLDRVHEIALEMLNIDNTRWEGHHWLGLFYDFIEDYDEAEVEFELAVKQDFDMKLDAINLAEDYFVGERFPECKKAVQIYNKFDVDAPVENAMVSSFLNGAAELLMTCDLSQEKKFDDVIGQKLGYKRNYDFEKISQFGENIGKKYLMKYSDAQRTSVKNMIRLLISSATGTKVELKVAEHM